MSEEGEKQIREAVEQAEEVKSPLDDLIERSQDNVGAPFEPEALRALAELRSLERADYEKLRHELKALGVRVGELDEAIDSLSCDRPIGSGRSAIQDPLTDFTLFQDSDRSAYAAVDVDGHREVFRVRHRRFKALLGHRIYAKTNHLAPAESIEQMVKLAEVRAEANGPTCDVFLRTAHSDGSLFVDLGDRRWRAIEINPNGWSVIDTPPVYFHRPQTSAPLPEPKRGGGISLLRPYLNVASENDFVLAVAWLLAALRPVGPYPVLVLTGEQGSAKSTFSRILRSLVDPSTTPLRSMPRSESDLFVGATHTHVLAFDNVSTLQPWLSDALCRIATGGGFAARALYTDQEEVALRAIRPIILNGIEEFVARPDLADRSITLQLKPIDDSGRKSEQELWEEFDRDRPAILGALLDAVARGLKELPHIALDRSPRMADFARWASACEPAIWPVGTFMAAYTGNIAEATDTMIEADPVAASIREMIGQLGEWTGTATDLLKCLNQGVDQNTRRAHSWPTTPALLSNRLRRAATALRAIGIEVQTHRVGRDRQRTITISRAAPADGTNRPSVPPDPDVPF